MKRGISLTFLFTPSLLLDVYNSARKVCFVSCNAMSEQTPDQFDELLSIYFLKKTFKNRMRSKHKRDIHTTQLEIPDSRTERNLEGEIDINYRFLFLYSLLNSRLSLAHLESISKEVDDRITRHISFDDEREKDREEMFTKQGWNVVVNSQSHDS